MGIVWSTWKYLAAAVVISAVLSGLALVLWFFGISRVTLSDLQVSTVANSSSVYSYGLPGELDISPISSQPTRTLQLAMGLNRITEAINRAAETHAIVGIGRCGGKPICTEPNGLILIDSGVLVQTDETDLALLIAADIAGAGAMPTEFEDRVISQTVANHARVWHNCLVWEKAGYLVGKAGFGLPRGMEKRLGSHYLSVENRIDASAIGRGYITGKAERRCTGEQK